MSRTAVYEKVEAKLILKTTTAATGSNWVQMGNANADAIDEPQRKCTSISVLNATGTTLSFGIGLVSGTAPTGETFELPSGTSYLFAGLTDSRQLFVRRNDVSNSQVTLKAFALN